MLTERHRFIMLAAFIALSVCIVAPVTHSAEIVSRLLQVKEGRFYFADGSERRVFPGARFCLIADQDTLLCGRIAQTFEGISWSAVTNDSIATGPENLDSAYALIQTADVDTDSEIRLACMPDLPLEHLMQNAGQSLAPHSLISSRVMATGHNGNHIVVVNERHDDNVLLQFENSRIDGYFTYEQPQHHRRPAVVKSFPAPFIVVLVPNLSRPANSGGLLTTSLYYRFEPDRLPYWFAGDSTMAITMLLPGIDSCPRAYAVNARRGREVLESITALPSRLTIGLSQSGLERMAEYFADILSRDRRRVDIVYDDVEADLFLTIIPFQSDSPLEGAQDLHSSLARTRPAFQAQQEALDLLAARMSSAWKATSDDQRQHYIELIDRTLKSDLGVFPLFRPTVFFVSGRDLADVQFSESGRVDLPALTKLVFPPDSEGWKQ